MTAHSTVRVELGPRSYDILVGPGLLREAGRFLAPLLRQPRAVVVTDENVAPLYLDTLEAALDQAGIGHEPVVLPAGETTKDFPHLQRLLETLLDLRIERKTTLIALGGGVVGDLAGFAASIVLRGVDLVQMPTTLLSQVDSSVGGKTGINTPHGKNLVGSFYQPRLVLTDVTTLNSLPRRELLAGYAEVVKHALIRDALFFEWLERHGEALRDGDEAARRDAVVRSCTLKAETVAADERESGLRALLNFGHTFGHALEAETGYSGELLHGEAVAIGMVMAFDLSVQLELCPIKDAMRVRRHLGKIGLPIAPTGIGRAKWDVGELLGHIRQDKKVHDGQVTFVLTRGIGRAFLASNVRLETVEKVLQNTVAA
ncbi:MAG: 3-dehydroquinate synthase [Alphaproteobacteria bacterium]